MKINEAISALQNILAEEGPDVLLEAHNPAGDIDTMDCISIRRKFNRQAMVIFWRKCDEDN